MTTFEVAVERRMWELVALHLLLAVSETASKLPADSLTALIELLSEEEPAEPGTRREDP
jgi:hypothetical protein